MYFNNKTIDKLSFPDFYIEKMEFDPCKKNLLIAVEGAWLEFNGGKKLGKGVLRIDSWETVIIKSYHPKSSFWQVEDPLSTDRLKDLCEVKYGDSMITLCGFGKKNGYWMEWHFTNPEISADFGSSHK